MSGKNSVTLFHKSNPSKISNKYFKCDCAVNVIHLFFSIGRPKHVRVMAGALEGEIFLGPEAEVSKLYFFKKLY